MMKKRFMKVLAFVLVAVMVAACGTNAAPADTGAAAAGGGAAAAGAAAPAGEGIRYSIHPAGYVNRFGWEVPEEPIYLSILFARGNYSPWESTIAGLQNHVNLLMEEFNVHVTPVHIDGDGTEYINLALAANNTPYDIITQLNRPLTATFIEQNRAVEMTPMLADSPNLYRLIDHLIPMLVDGDGRLWRIPQYLGAIYELPDHSAHLRYDEWIAIGRPEIRTPEDYRAALYAILEMFPLTPEGETRFAMSLPGFGPGLLNTFAGFWGHKSGFRIEDGGRTWTHWTGTDDGRDMSRWFNQFHRDGTLDPEAFVHGFGEWREMFSRERIVGAIGGWWIGFHAGHEIWMNIDPDLPPDKRFFQLSFNAPGTPGTFLSPKTEISTYGTIITNFARDPVSAMKFIDFQASPMGQKLAGWGIPNGTPIGDTGRMGLAWELHPDGSWNIYEPARQQLITETWNYNEADFFLAHPYVVAYQSRWDDGIHNFWLNQMWYEENYWRQLMIENMDGTIFDATAMQVMEPTDEFNLLNTAINDAIGMMWPHVALANSDAEFDAAWNALQAELEMAGIRRMEEIRAELYMANQ